MNQWHQSHNSARLSRQWSISPVSSSRCPDPDHYTTDLYDGLVLGRVLIGAHDRIGCICHIHRIFLRRDGVGDGQRVDGGRRRRGGIPAGVPTIAARSEQDHDDARRYSPEIPPERRVNQIYE